MTFWSSWALWEKLCFVLACGIVLTVLAGIVKLVYKHWQLRKYTALAAKRKEEAREMQRTHSVKRAKGPEIPFGVRAIESGVEVDGVWISRPNTPVPSSRGSPGVSPVIEPQMTRGSLPSQISDSHISQMAMPQPVYSYRRSDGSQSSLGSKSLDSQFERATSAERLPSRNGSPAPRLGHQPRQSSHLRFSNEEDLQGHSRTNSRNVQAGSPHDSDENQSLRKSGSTSSSEEEIPNHYIPRRYDPSAHTRYHAFSQGNTEEWPLSQTNGESLDYLRGRREIHAAETGQLLPRRRVSGASGDWTSNISHRNDKSIPLDHISNRSPSPPENPFATPLETPLPQVDGTDAPSFQSFLESDPVTTRWQSNSFLGRQEVPEPQDLARPFEDGRASRYLQQQQVVRKVNSGFEILRPGTLDVPRQSSVVFDSKPDQEKGNKRPSKRLQKKNRSESISENTSRVGEES